MDNKNVYIVAYLEYHAIGRSPLLHGVRAESPEEAISKAKAYLCGDNGSIYLVIDVSRINLSEIDIIKSFVGDYELAYGLETSIGLIPFMEIEKEKPSKKKLMLDLADLYGKINDTDNGFRIVTIMDSIEKRIDEYVSLLTERK